jgi:TetR/AcrR family transcriptional repressor of nem operon
MGRPREFDEDAVLDAVMRQFHERGYHATALSNLVGATGLHKGSLYGAFGDKHSLFVIVLLRYADHRLELLDTDLAAATTPLAGIRDYLLRQANEAVGGRGCLLANSALELLPGDQDVERIVSRQHERVQGRLASALDRARVAGDMSGDAQSAPMARYLFTIVEGLWELGRATEDAALLEGIVDVAMGSIA